MSGLVDRLFYDPRPILNLGIYYAYPTAEQEAANGVGGDTATEVMARIQFRERQRDALDWLVTQKTDPRTAGIVAEEVAEVDDILVGLKARLQTMGHF